MTNKMNITQMGAVTTIELLEDLKLFVTSDVHFDSLECNREVFMRDLTRAKEEDALIFLVGDFFDAMQGRFDPRRSYEDLREEYKRSDYYDVIVDDAVDKLKEFAPNLLLVADGNHELSVLKNANVNILNRFTSQMNAHGGTALRGGYGGLILIKAGDVRIKIKYFHGSGGEAPVTRGAIQTNRQAVFLPDYELILNGHSHHMYWIPIVRERLTSEGQHYFDIQHHVRTPGYVQSYGDGSAGWTVTRGGVPKPLGGAFIDFRLGVPKDEALQIRPVIHAPGVTSSIANLLYEGPAYPQE